MTAQPEQTETPAGNRHQHQTFLVGDSVYLRTLEPGDEKYATSWRQSIFPVSPETVEKWIKEELPKEGKNKRGHMVIVRKSDDVIVGSIRVHMGDTRFVVSCTIDPLLGEQGERSLAEALVLYADWQVNEHSWPSVMVNMFTTTPLAIELVREGGFVETCRFREALHRNNQRYDRVCLTLFNPAWLNRLGDPMETPLEIIGSGTITPIRTHRHPAGDPPKNAVICGERVYLRPLDKTDAAREIELSRMETETFFDIGRQLMSEANLADVMSSKASDNHPRNYGLAVCLLADDTVIGNVGLWDLDLLNRTAETESWIPGGEYRGQGYGTEAKQLLLEYAFDVLGLHMVRSLVFFPNTRSAAALRKQGYQHAGRMCWLYPYQGGFGHMAAFDLLASEWRALPRASAQSVANGAG